MTASDRARKNRALQKFIAKRYQRRKIVNGLAYLAIGIATLTALVPLFSVSEFILRKGLPGLNWDFFTGLPQPVGEPGSGMANSIVGTAILVLLGSLIGLPWGIAIGIYLAEYGRGRAAGIVRFSVDMLSSVPSIIVGLFVYTAIVVPMKQFSAFSGGVALGILMIPTIARSSEELLKLVPQHIREAGLALGLPRWKVVLQIVLRGSMSGIITAVILAIARVAGETAPLLFTAFNNRFWHDGLGQPISSLPVQIYTYAISPYDEWHRQAWAAALVLVVFVFAVNLGARTIFRNKTKGSHV